MKTVGIIGGLGPKTTSEFYLELVSSSRNLDKSNRPPILIYSVPLSYNTEERAIKNGIIDGGEYLPILVEGANKLEKSGADFLVIPCNSVHIYIEEVRKSVKIPVLSIVEETSRFLKEENISE